MSGPLTIEDMANMPNPSLDANFNLHRIDASEEVCRALSSQMDNLRMALVSVRWTENDNRGSEFGVAEPRGVVKLTFTELQAEQAWIDACAALVNPLSAVVLETYYHDGRPRTHLTFSGLTRGFQVRKLDGGSNAVHSRVYSYSFESVKETLLEHQTAE